MRVGFPVSSLGTVGTATYKSMVLIGSLTRDVRHSDNDDKINHG